jgi:hypothetical protein
MIAVRIGQGSNLPHLAIFRYPVFKAFVKTGPELYIYPLDLSFHFCSKIFIMRCFRLCFLLFSLFLFRQKGSCAPPKQEFYSIKIYQLKTAQQEERVNKYLQTAFLPALHRLGIAQIGVFTPVDNDTAAIRRIYVLIPFPTLDLFLRLPGLLEKDTQYLASGKDYLDAVYSDPPYLRVESILLKAFPEMPRLKTPVLTTAHSERIYELRSYESPTEKLHNNKIQMFNRGGEVSLFARLGFNAVFYASVLSGSHMPNLMYMTSFDNKASRDQHWKTFGDDPFWKQLSASPEYQHNVSKAEILFLHPADFSDL